MKKLKYLLLCILFIPVIAHAATGSSGMSYQECLAFSDMYKNITGSYEYKYCYRAGCSSYQNGTWNYANMVVSSGYRCSNGNSNPYTKMTSDGCSKYKGSCNATTAIYCTRVQTVNCNLKSDGTPYSGTTTPVTQTQTKKTVSPGPTGTKTKQTQSRQSGSSKIIITTTEATKKTEQTRPVITTEPTETTTTEPAKSSNVGIKRILINGTDLKYRNEYNEYNIKLKKGVRDLEIVVETEDENAITYIDGAHNMTDEDSTVKITVEAENGEKKTVTVNVKRYEGESSDCNIANIAMPDYEIKNFDKNTYDYTLTIKNKTKALNLEIIPSDPLHAEYEVTGNQNLDNNSVITIAVKAEDGNMCYYKIKMRKASRFWTILFIIIIVTVLLLLAGYLVYRYIKRSKNQYEYE